MPSVMLCRDQKFISSYSPAVTAAALSLVAMSLAGCDRNAPDALSNDVQTETPTTAKKPASPTVPTQAPALTRGDLVSAAGQAASAYAQGRPLASADPLVGRRFAVSVPFGCNGPAPAGPASDEGKGDGMARWAWEADRKTIQLRMTPSDWTGSAMLAKADASDKWEAVEGFWIPRPWLASESCPAVQTDPLQTAASPPSPQTVGLAAVFEAGGSRIGRRNGRAYEFTIRQKGEAPLPAPENGFRMRLDGRIASFPSGRAIECQAAGPDQRPVCIVAIQLDRFSYVDSGGSTLSEWRVD